MYWTANTVDADGHLTEETTGAPDTPPALVVQRSFDAFSGRLTQIVGNSSEGANNIVNLSYQWDALGNLLLRTDSIETYDESFCYDPLNRLTNYALQDGGGSTCTSGTIVKSMGYDANFPGGVGDGNITTKSDIGGYVYGQNGAGPHALTSILTTSSGGCTLTRCLVDGVSSPNFQYDADGNMLCVTTAAKCDGGAARSYSWTSFDMAASLVKGTDSNSFGYTPEHQRGALTTASGTLWYFSNPAAGVFNELAPGGTQWRTYLSAYGHIVAEFFTGSTTKTYYFAGDHLASTTALTDMNGNGVEYDSYDAWGNRRNANGNDYPTGCFTSHPSSFTLRGYTSQEEMDDLCLVNLNGRLYDPALGRMLSADPTVPDALNGQAFDRYSYVVNNPLSLIDPSGYTSATSCVATGTCAPHPNCVSNCWQGGMCLDCTQPTYSGWDAMSFFLAMGGLEGFGSTGAGSFGGGTAPDSSGAAVLLSAISIADNGSDLNSFPQIGTGDDGMPLFASPDATGILFYSGISYPVYLGELPTLTWAFGEGPVYIVQPDGSLEIRMGGSLAWRDNNPGNLRPGYYPSRDGSIGTNYSQNGPFAIFPNLATGQDALTDLLASKYGNDSLSTALAAYAPPGENNTAAYIANLSNALNVSPTTIISTLSETQFEDLEAAIVTQESFYSGIVETVPPPYH